MMSDIPLPILEDKTPEERYKIWTSLVQWDRLSTMRGLIVMKALKEMAYNPDVIDPHAMDGGEWIYNEERFSNEDLRKMFGEPDDDVDDWSEDTDELDGDYTADVPEEIPVVGPVFNAIDSVVSSIMDAVRPAPMTVDRPAVRFDVNPKYKAAETPVRKGRNPKAIGTLSPASRASVLSERAQYEIDTVKSPSSKDEDLTLDQKFVYGARNRKKRDLYENGMPVDGPERQAAIEKSESAARKYADLMEKFANEEEKKAAEEEPDRDDDDGFVTDKSRVGDDPVTNVVEDVVEAVEEVVRPVADVIDNAVQSVVEAISVVDTAEKKTTTRRRRRRRSKTELQKARAKMNRYYRGRPKGKKADIRRKAKRTTSKARDYVPNQMDFKGQKW